MKRRVGRLPGASWLLWILATVAPGRGADAASRPDELLVGGQSRVLIVDIARSTVETPAVVWVWDAHDAAELPPVYRERLFEKIDDVKPVAGGTMIAISASTGGVALIERATRRAVFFCAVANAHSVELLPDGSLAVASSVNPQGNYVAVFKVDRPEALPIWRDPLVSAHGVVWSETARGLYALGGTELRLYRPAGKSSGAVLVRERSWALPEAGGHDLQAIPGTGDLLVRTTGGVWRFSSDRERFEPFAPLDRARNVKSLSVNSATGRLAFVQALSDKEWWSDCVRLLEPERELRFPGLRLYKARWHTPAAVKDTAVDPAR